MGLVDTSINIPSTNNTTTTTTITINTTTTANSMLFSMEPHKPVPAPFLIKTYQLVDEPSTDHIVSWGEDNTTFVVWRSSEFARDLLSKYFKHNNFSSFVRQLNTYGFRKIVPDRWEFANEFFIKGEKHLLCEIHRRKTSPPSSSSPSCYFSDLNYWCNNSTMNVTNTTSASMFLQDNERLRRNNAELVSEITHMKKLYNDIIYFVQNHVTPVAPSGANASLLSGGGGCGGGGGGGGRGRDLDSRHSRNHSSFSNDSEELEAKEKKRGFGGTKLFGVVLDVEERSCGDLPLCKRGRLDLLL